MLVGQLDIAVRNWRKTKNSRAPFTFQKKKKDKKYLYSKMNISDLQSSKALSMWTLVPTRLLRVVVKVVDIVDTFHLQVAPSFLVLFQLIRYHPSFIR
jgi:hypothetical protein